MDNPRKLAFSSLVRADALSSYSNIEINTVISRSDMNKKNAALYTALYMGVTEKLITLDYVISQYSSIPTEKLDIETKNALRLGLYQMMFMDKIPEYSAVSETVNLCPKKSKGFVNAVLRSFIRNGRSVEYPDDEWEELSIKTSTPPYIIDIFRYSYGDTTARELLCASVSHEGISLRVNTLKSSAEDVIGILDKRGIGCRASELCPHIIIAEGSVSDIEDIILSGTVFVQDSSSCVATEIVGVGPGMNVLDACACPGGKTFSMAIDMNNSGSITACDLHKSKLSLIKNGCSRLGIDIVKAEEQNGKIYRADFSDAFDKVLCDVPCSGLGVIAKKPDIKYKKQDSVDNLPAIQYDILSNCSGYVKVGGELIYSTCTLNKRENEDIVSSFLNSHSDFEPVAFSYGNIRSENGMYTFMPHINGGDGFFVAKMRRIR